jgi:regulator of protease activity HflC (stomatin/prohibitin superfamily)
MTSLLAQIPFQALVVLGSALVTVFKSIAFVQEGQRGVKLRFGKAVRYRTGKNAGRPKIVEPGFVFMIPYIDKLQRRHVRQETVRLDYQKIMFKDGMIFQVSAMLLFTVTDVFKAMFEIDGLNDAVETFGLATLREELSSRSHKDLADHETIGKALLDRISQKGEEWGVKFHAFKLTDCSPTVETEQLVLMETGVPLKTQALQGAANELGCKILQLNSQLGAVLLGFPLVGAVGTEKPTQVDASRDEKDDGAD